MSTRQKLTTIRKMIGSSQPEDKFDSLVLSALMDEISGTAPQGHADDVERKLHARTGYAFPHNAELKKLFDSAKDGAEHIRRLRDGD
ncbi:hypothetical protein QDQ55_23645 [Enterobacter hormaechei]|uniref:hypothetical protein n=1 Tax=Enterobacter cloacae complex TaxID=354276 RepID=UPI0024475264|nr:MULTISPECIES: hypothetical protein [Enterobacter cloacae complex]MDG9952674.1 hypothetical protein [Enterobacter roggenkampii]MDR9940080.1 hypothetical protein [Enterobacter hormaechei subsp. xiangfangensis]